MTYSIYDEQTLFTDEQDPFVFLLRGYNSLAEEERQSNFDFLLDYYIRVDGRFRRIYSPEGGILKVFCFKTFEIDNKTYVNRF